MATKPDLGGWGGSGTGRELHWEGTLERDWGNWGWEGGHGGGSGCDTGHCPGTAGPWGQPCVPRHNPGALGTVPRAQPCPHAQPCPQHSHRRHNRVPATVGRQEQSVPWAQLSLGTAPPRHSVPPRHNVPPLALAFPQLILATPRSRWHQRPQLRELVTRWGGDQLPPPPPHKLPPRGHPLRWGGCREGCRCPGPPSGELGGRCGGPGCLGPLTPPLSFGVSGGVRRGHSAPPSRPDTWVPSAQPGPPTAPDAWVPRLPPVGGGGWKWEGLGDPQHGLGGCGGAPPGP